MFIRVRLFNPMVCSSPGSSVHGILLARILECVTIPFSTGSSQSRDWTWISRIAGIFLTIGVTSKSWDYLHIYITFPTHEDNHFLRTKLNISCLFYVAWITKYVSYLSYYISTQKKLEFLDWEYFKTYIYIIPENIVL